MEHFGNSLKKLMRRHHMLHKHMAQEIGVSPQRFYQITKLADVKLGTAIKILGVLDMSVDEFLEFCKETEGKPAIAGY